MRREPSLVVGVLVAVAIAVLNELGAGNIDSLEDIVTIALPIVGAWLVREQVTPV